MKKKKSIKRSISHKHRPHAIKHASKRDFNWIIYVGSCVAIFAIVGGFVAFSHKAEVRQAVAGISVTRGLFAQATIPLPVIPGATG